MEYTRLGRTGVKVSRFCLGTMNFGWQTEEENSFAIMDQAHDLGINFFDTANVYGRQKGEGVTEQILGNWFSQGGRRREKTVLATKVFGEMGDWPNESRLSALHIKRACEDSLRRLKTDYIDLYQMHHVWREVTWEEVWQAMEQLVKEGKVLYAGSSNFAAWHLMQANAVASSRHFLGLVSEQSLYNLNTRTVELEVLPACEANGLAFLPWSPLASGLLGGILKKANMARRSSDWVKERLDKCRPRVEAYEKLCDEIGEDPSILALAWLLSRPGVTAPIVGPRTLDQLDHSLKALNTEISGEVLKKLDEIFPGPGGEAPEAYAW